MKFRKYNKIFLLLVFVIILIIMLINLGNNEIKPNIENPNEIKNLKKENNDFVVNIEINGTAGVYDKDKKIYHYASNNEEINKIKIISPYKTNYSLKKQDNQYIILIYTEKYYQERIININNNPIINITTNYEIKNYRKNENEKYSQSIIGESEPEIINASINLIEPYQKENKMSLGTFKIRGATSQNFEKKSYKINLDEKLSLFNLTVDNDYILDALYTDTSKVRNKLSYDIWNLINNNQEIQNDLNSTFLDLFIDNEYYGLYVVKNKINKKITNIQDNGLLIKIIDHNNDNYKNLLLRENYAVVNDTFLNYEIKNYTNNSLNNFIQKMQNYYALEKSDISIKNNFDVNNYVNYKILLAITSGADNITKNQYYSITDEESKILITPWDLDLTWGLKYSTDTELRSILIPESYSNKEWLDENILEKNAPEINEMIKQRYRELRKKEITVDTINSYLNEYKELLITSGTAKRDSDKWYYYDVEYEIEQIRIWAENRIKYLDEYFKI